VEQSWTKACQSVHSTFNTLNAQQLLTLEECARAIAPDSNSSARMNHHRHQHNAMRCCVETTIKVSRLLVSILRLATMICSRSAAAALWIGLTMAASSSLMPVQIYDDTELCIQNFVKADSNNDSIINREELFGTLGARKDQNHLHYYQLLKQTELTTEQFILYFAIPRTACFSQAINVLAVLASCLA
jgi:hypothetical protein